MRVREKERKEKEKAFSVSRFIVHGYSQLHLDIELIHCYRRIYSFATTMEQCCLRTTCRWKEQGEGKDDKILYRDNFVYLSFLYPERVKQKIYYFNDSSRFPFHYGLISSSIPFWRINKNSTGTSYSPSCFSFLLFFSRVFFFFTFC